MRVEISKEVKISVLLLCIPLVITIALLFPSHEEYVATGNIVSVEELGIDGSVYFTYVKSGISENMYEKLILTAFHNDIQFNQLKPSEIDNYMHQMEEMESYKEEVVYHAVHLPIFDQYTDSTDLYFKMMDILDKSSLYAGDSFGLMIAIGLYEEMYHKDFSNNSTYIIAGTGTINPDNTVGEVGAIRHKLLTAEQNQVDIFFIPKHKDSYNEEVGNFEEALQIVKNEGLTFQVVPVATFDEAIEYLEKLDSTQKGWRN